MASRLPPCQPSARLSSPSFGSIGCTTTLGRLSVRHFIELLACYTVYHRTPASLSLSPFSLFHLLFAPSCYLLTANNAANSPGPAAYHTALYISTTETMLVFGGYSQGPFLSNTIYLWNARTNTWSTPAVNGGQRPLAGPFAAGVIWQTTPGPVRSRSRLSCPVLLMSSVLSCFCGV